MPDSIAHDHYHTHGTGGIVHTHIHGHRDSKPERHVNTISTPHGYQLLHPNHHLATASGGDGAGTGADPAPDRDPA